MSDTKKKTLDSLKRYDQIKVEIKEADAIKDKLMELSPSLRAILEK